MNTTTVFQFQFQFQCIQVRFFDVRVDLFFRQFMVNFNTMKMNYSAQRWIYSLARTQYETKRQYIGQNIQEIYERMEWTSVEFSLIRKIREKTIAEAIESNTYTTVITIHSCYRIPVNGIFACNTICHNNSRRIEWLYYCLCMTDLNSKNTVKTGRLWITE